MSIKVLKPGKFTDGCGLSEADPEISDRGG